MIDTKFIKARREKLGLTQEQAAKLAGMSTRFHWSRMENGSQRSPRVETLVAVAKALKCSVNKLIAKG